MYLRRLKVINFQAHAETELFFDEYSTSVGPKEGAVPNNVGKTSLLRALKILIHHLNYTEKHLRYGTDYGLIECETWAGFIVRRELKNKKQIITILDPNGKEVPFDGKKDATSFVLDVFGIKKITLDPGTDPEDFNFIPADAENKFLKDRSDVLLRKIISLIGSQNVENICTDLQSEIKELKKEITAIDKTLIEQTQEYETKQNYLNLYCENMRKQKICVEDIQDIQRKIETSLKLSDYFVKNNSENILKTKKLIDVFKTRKDKYTASIELLTTLNTLYNNLNLIITKKKAKEQEKILLLNEKNELIANAPVEELCEKCGKPL